MKIEVWDRDVLFHDHIGSLVVRVPDAPPADGAWHLGPFGQVRALVLRVS